MSPVVSVLFFWYIGSNPFPAIVSPEERSGRDKQCPERNPDNNNNEFNKKDDVNEYVDVHVLPHPIPWIAENRIVEEVGGGGGVRIAPGGNH